VRGERRKGRKKEEEEKKNPSPGHIPNSQKTASQLTVF
jgi:hypothetical protein